VSVANPSCKRHSEGFQTLCLVNKTKLVGLSACWVGVSGHRIAVVCGVVDNPSHLLKG